MATLQSTLNELHTLNQITNNVAVAGITFDAIQLVEAQKARITELEAHITEFKRDARAAAIADRDKIAELEVNQTLELETYDAGFLPAEPDQDFIRYILGCAHEFYQQQAGDL